MHASAADMPTIAGTGAAPRGAHASARAGVLYGVAAYGSWGLLPMYFKAIRSVPTLEVLAHRVLWSMLLLVLLMAVRRSWRSALAALRCRRTLLTLTATTALIACNWLLFIWAIAHDRLLQSSLGYFINPLINVLLGLIFLGERLRRWQTASVLLAAGGVTYLTLSAGEPPLIALTLAITFGLYGLLRKVANVDAPTGLTVETALLAPLALGFLLYEMNQQRAVFLAQSRNIDLLLILAGLITATPLVWFAAAARRLRLTTLGFLQYLSPTGHFLLAVVAYGEPLNPGLCVAFACIWAALVIYSIDALRSARPTPAALLPE